MNVSHLPHSKYRKVPFTASVDKNIKENNGVFIDDLKISELVEDYTLISLIRGGKCVVREDGETIQPRDFVVKYLLILQGYC